MAARAGVEPAHGHINSMLPYQLGYLAINGLPDGI